MIIVNKDRDKAIEFSGKESNLYSQAKWHNGICLGINLYYKNFMLGTFDTVKECMEEISKIMSCTDDFYYISGFSNYDGWEDWHTLCALMAEGEADRE